MGEIKILVIDDELFYREWIRDCLEPKGHKIYSAGTAREGLELARKINPEVALVDIVLPGSMDGLAVLFKLKKEFPDLPVIMLSAYDEKKLILSALKRGAFDYLIKPISKTELEHSIKKAYEQFQLIKDQRAKLNKLAQLERGSSWLKDFAHGRIEFSRLSGAYQLLQTTVELVSQVLDCERVSVMLLDPKMNRLRVVVSKGLSPALIKKETRSPQKSPSGWVLKNKVAVLVKDVYSDERFQASEYAPQYKTNSFVIAPLLVGGEVVGTINANDKSDGSAFNEDDLILLQTFSHQVALTLQYLQAIAELEQEKKRLSMMVELEKILLEEREPRQMFKKILKKCQELLKVVSAFIYLIDDENRSQLNLFVGWDGAREVKFSHSIPLGKSATGKVAKQGKSLLINNLEQDKDFLVEIEYPQKVAIKNYLAVPLFLEDEVWGVLRVLNKKTGNFHKDDQSFLEELARSVGIALRNLELWRKLEQSVEEVIKTNQLLRRINQELEALKKRKVK